MERCLHRLNAHPHPPCRGPPGAAAPIHQLRKTSPMLAYRTSACNMAWLLQFTKLQWARIDCRSSPESTLAHRMQMQDVSTCFKHIRCEVARFKLPMCKNTWQMRCEHWHNTQLVNAPSVPEAFQFCRCQIIFNKSHFVKMHEPFPQWIGNCQASVAHTVKSCYLSEW